MGRFVKHQGKRGGQGLIDLYNIKGREGVKDG
jgi:hypothetical protein